MAQYKINGISLTRSTSDAELLQILALQKKNMAGGRSKAEVQKEGFITVNHTFEILKKMNDACPHIVAKDHENVVGYALVMLRSFREEIPALRPMFDTADTLLPHSNYVAMGQVCIAKSYRKKGLFRRMYQYYKEQLRDHYECLLTEVARTNQRSLHAHKAIGFKVFDTRITDGVSWELMKWQW